MIYLTFLTAWIQRKNHTNSLGVRVCLICAREKKTTKKSACVNFLCECSFSFEIAHIHNSSINYNLPLPHAASFLNFRINHAYYARTVKFFVRCLGIEIEYTHFFRLINAMLLCFFSIKARDVALCAARNEHDEIFVCADAFTLIRHIVRCNRVAEAALCSGPPFLFSSTHLFTCYVCAQSPHTTFHRVQTRIPHNVYIEKLCCFFYFD